MTIDRLAEQIRDNTFHEDGKVLLYRDEVVEDLASFMSLLFVPFDKERFIRKCKGE